MLAVVLPIVEDPEIARFAPPIFPVDVILETVVDASVELPDIFRFVKYPVTKAAMLPKIFVTVVDARVEDPVAFRFVTFSTVTVELVNVAFVAESEVGLRVEIERLVIVAFVIVELVTTSFVTLLVLAFVVEA